MDRHDLGQRVRTFQHFSRRKKMAAVGVMALAVLLVIPLLTYAYFARDINDRERLINRNSTGITLLDKNGQVIYSFGKAHQQNDVKLSQISNQVEEALIASEDKDFYNHPGVSFKAMARALYANILNKDATRYGGSTITQQLVRNTLLSSSKNFLRKYQEFYMAIAIERHYTKQEILEMYLNSAYFGEGAFGIGPAARIYFGKTPEQLTLAEGSLLIGILPAPSMYSPISGDFEMAKKHQARVLDQMAEHGYITTVKRDEALNEKLTFNQAPVSQNEHAKHFSEMVLTELKERYGEERVIRSGFEVITSLNLDWQKFAEGQVRKRVSELSTLGGTNASVVAIDPKSGEIRTLVGSVNWDEPNFGKVNMALSPRQPGSSFKPIYYAEALQERIITPATILHDEPKTYDTYKPRNYDFRFMGDLTVRRALALSRNLTAVEVMQKLGVDKGAKAARDMGISTVNDPEKYGLTLAVGTAEVRLLDMVNAYASFANEGRQFTPSTIVSINDKFNKTVFTKRTSSKQAQGKESAFLISSILSDTQARAPNFNSLNISGWQVAAKTGTTDDNRDAWTIGYSPSVSVGVWVGNNESKPMSGVAGASGAGPIWRSSMMRFLEGTAKENFKQPSSIIRVQICSGSGLRAVNQSGSTYPEYFIRGSEPRHTCNDRRDRDEEQGRKNEEKKEEKKEEGGGGNPGPPPPPPPEPTEPPPPPPPVEPPPPPPPPPTGG